jgi:hypothetical protein
MDRYGERVGSCDSGLERLLDAPGSDLWRGFAELLPLGGGPRYVWFD